MDRDIRQTSTYHETHEFFRRFMEPGFGEVVAAVDPSVRADGRAVAMTGTILERLEGRGRTRIAIADGDGLRLATRGQHDDRFPRWSPDGQALAFLSDRAEEGVFQLYLLHADLGEAIGTTAVEGSVEYCAWSPDGRRILMGVAALGADRAGGQGSGTTTVRSSDVAAWLPEVSSADESRSWRSVWVYDTADGAVRCVSPDGMNVWEAAWIGDGHLACVASDGDPSEGAWYTASVVFVELTSGDEAVLYRPETQLGWPAGSPDGRLLAVVEGISSDRWIVAGDVRLVERATGSVRTLQTPEVDVTGLQWLNDRRLGFTGVRGLEIVVGVFDVETGTCRELFSSQSSSGYRYPEAAFAPDGTAALILESYEEPPAVTMVGLTGTRVLATFAHDGTDWIASVAGTSEAVSWRAPDGLEIQGLLCKPEGDGPFPLVVQVHGGPVGSHRSRWRMVNEKTKLLVSRGFAVLHPNPRGSTGRGQKFARAVVGDMGGADAEDILAGIDALVDRGLADTGKIGVAGGSYGGFMSCWLITQDQRFAAAVASHPTTNWYSQHHTSNIGQFDAIFLEDDPYAAAGSYFQRSPVMHAGNVRTPTLLIAGSRDRCTPPTQAEEFHNALRDNDVESVLVMYPQEAHGVQTLPARIDATARTLAWFEKHMPPAVPG